MAFFGELYLRSTRPFLSAATTAREARFIGETLELKPECKALDLGCGHGRHLERLVAQGLDVVGLDHDPLSLAALEPSLRRRVVRGDLFALPFGPAFDAVYAWYATLFIRAEDEANLAALREASRVLKPGGRLLVHGHNPVVQAREGASRFATRLDDGSELAEETWYDPAANVLHGHRTLLRDGRLLEGSFLVRCPTAADHQRWARQLGLSLEALYGDVEGLPASATAPDLIALYRGR